AVTVVVAVVGAVVVFGVNAESGGSDSAGDAMTWDDTLYPQEIPSIYRELTTDDVLESVIGRPKPAWTTPITGGRPDVVGGDDKIITLRSGTFLIGLDATTGAASWPSVDLGESPMSCAVHGNRIGCVAPPGRGADSSVFILDSGSGALLKTIKVPNQNLRRIVVAGDRLVVATEFGDGDGSGFAAGYTTEGDEVWTHEGSEDLYVVPGQHILVDGSYSGDEVAFHDTDDGEKVLEAGRVRDERDLTWNVFRGGIAVQNEDWTGADIYDLDGKKVSSVAGWEPAGYQNVYAPGSTLPVFTRIKENHYRDNLTMAVANPETGHLLWRVEGPELTAQMVTVNDKLIVKIADPDASTGPGGTPEPTGKEFVRVHDVYSGEALSPPIDMTRDVAVETAWLKSDGAHVVYNYIERNGGHTEVAYAISTGEKSWEIPMAGRSGYPGGAIVAATAEDAVSLYR
ncbi:MAG: PQQ-binding-like beta-propeller repeat protein, partial [Actinophytocola sp.]|uniref:outer membrane protein assembly factor BamB family protein n=1 Tax=Actinophytocola sp. TaxID=1872138 RepID=UPI003C781C04